MVGVREVSDLKRLSDYFFRVGKDNSTVYFYAQARQRESRGGGRKGGSDSGSGLSGRRPCLRHAVWALTPASHAIMLDGHGSVYVMTCSFWLLSSC